MRFTVKNGRLYALALGWPGDGKLKIETLAKDSKHLPGAIGKVEMLACMHR